MTFNIIATVDQDLGIGLNGTLPWEWLSQDRNYCNDLISKSIVILSSEVFYNSGFITKFSPGFPNIKDKVLITKERKPGQAATFESAYARALLKITRNESIFVLGGGKVFKEAMTHPHLSLLYLTEVFKVFTCDTYFPRYNTKKFKLIYTSPSIVHISENGDFEYRHSIYKKER